MANKKISEFPVTTTLAGNDAFLINHLGSTNTVAFSSVSNTISQTVSTSITNSLTQPTVINQLATNFIKKPQTASTAQVLTYDGSTTTWVASAAPVGLATVKAWVNFNGTGTVAIRASGNVSSITDNGTGNYTVNFTTALQDANYAVLCTADGTAGIAWTEILPSNLGGAQTTSSIRVGIRGTTAYADTPTYCVAVFR